MRNRPIGMDSPGVDPVPVRSLFVSDLHLGCRHADAKGFLKLLDQYEPSQLYIVGDFIDGWKLRRRWHWEPTYTRILRRLLELTLSGMRICYAPGNHDDFFREFFVELGNVEVADEFIHPMTDGRSLLVLHGDRFDRIETGAPWISKAACFAYDALLTANKWYHHFFGSPRTRPYAVSGAVKRAVKRVVNFVSDFETRIASHATESGCHGVVCGHIHSPAIARMQDILYCNTGDWLENSTALVEHFTGELELVQQIPDGTQQVLFAEAPGYEPDQPDILRGPAPVAGTEHLQEIA